MLGALSVLLLVLYGELGGSSAYFRLPIFGIMSSHSTLTAQSSNSRLHQPLDDPALRGGGTGSIRDQLDRVAGGIKRRTKHLRNIQFRIEQAHAKIAELQASIAPLQQRMLLEANSIQNLRAQASKLECCLNDEEVHERVNRWLNSSFPGLASSIDHALLVSVQSLFRELSDAWHKRDMPSQSTQSTQDGAGSKPTLAGTIATPNLALAGNRSEMIADGSNIAAKGKVSQIATSNEGSDQVGQAPAMAAESDRLSVPTLVSMFERRPVNKSTSEVVRTRPINFEVAKKRLHILSYHVQLTSSTGECGAATCGETDVGSSKRRRPKKRHNKTSIYSKIAAAVASGRMVECGGGWVVPPDDSC